jgi:aryl-alcohol dehydrogenase-like predicted oxidoreductase
MKYLHLHGLEVSQLCLGTWHLPPSTKEYSDGIYRVDRQETERIVRKAWDLGINFFDTANTYHGTVSETHLHPEHSGNAERILGSCLSGYERESVVIATKVRAEVARFPNGGGLSRKHISWQIVESLKRLKTKYVDLYQIHWEDEFTPPEETMGILNDIVHRGLVHYIGVSNHTAGKMERMQEISSSMGYERFITMQEPYNIADREVENEKIAVARKYRMDMLAYVPLAQGILSGKYLGGIPAGSRASYISELKSEADRLKQLATRVAEAAKELQITPSQLSLAWILRMQKEHGIAIVPVIGATNLAHLEENCAAVDVNLPEDVFRGMHES